MSTQTSKKKTTILIVSNSHVTPSGMSEALRLIFGGLMDHFPEQYDIHQVGLFHVLAVVEELWPIYPTESKVSNGDRVLNMSDLHGQETAPKIIKKVRPDIVFVFNDPQHVGHFCVEQKEREHKVVFYVNIDSIPAPRYAARLDLADRIVTMSEFALKALKKSHDTIAEERSSFLYSPADTERFSPSSSEDRLENRQDLFPDGLPEDAFVLGWVGQNQWRKQIWLPYKVIHYLRRGGYLECRECERVSLIDWDPIEQQFSKEGGSLPEARPGSKFDRCGHCGSTKIEPGVKLEDVYLWMHMPRNDPHGLWPVPMIESLYDLEMGREVFYTEGHSVEKALPPEHMPTLYQMWDALLYLTGGEGFGIPPWEAMCTELPVIYTNYSSHAEFLNEAEAGLPVGGTGIPYPKAGPFTVVADASAAVEAVLKLYRNRELGRELGKNGRQYVQKHNLKAQAKKWHTLFQEVLAEGD